MTTPEAEPQGVIDDVHQLVAWRPLAGLVDRYHRAPDAPSKALAAIDCAMFVLDRLEPSGMGDLRRLLAYTYAAVDGSPQVRKLVTHLSDMAGDEIERKGVAFVGRSQQ